MTRSVRDSSLLDLSVYPALNFEGLERRANYRVIAFREDMLHVLEKREAAAIIFQIIFRWQEYLRDKALEEIEQRRNRSLPPLTPAEVEERLWVYMSYARFVCESGGAVSYNTVIRALAYLVDKKVVEQRANQNPRTAEYADYEYRINRLVVYDLLKALPDFPGSSSKKGHSVRTANAFQADPPAEVTSCTHLGTALAPSPHMDTPATYLGTPSPSLGKEGSPSGDTIQNILQDSLQESRQQQKASGLADDPQAAAVVSPLGTLSPEEIALVLAHRQDTPSQATPAQAPAAVAEPLDENDPLRSFCDPPVLLAIVSPEITNICPAHKNQSQLPPQDAPDTLSVMLPNQTKASPPEDTLSAEALVALIERKHGMPYDIQARPLQLAAAHTLLDLNLALDLALVDRLYDACYDDWWQAHYGDLHLTHLVEREKHGQPRITRLLARLRARNGSATRQTTIASASEQGSGQHPAIGVSGRPLFHLSGQPLKVLPPERSPHRRSIVAGLGV